MTADTPRANLMKHVLAVWKDVCRLSLGRYISNTSFSPFPGTRGGKTESRCELSRTVIAYSSRCLCSVGPMSS